MFALIALGSILLSQKDAARLQSLRELITLPPVNFSYSIDTTDIEHVARVDTFEKLSLRPVLTVDEQIQLLQLSPENEKTKSIAKKTLAMHPSITAGQKLRLLDLSGDVDRADDFAEKMTQKTDDDKYAYAQFQLGSLVRSIRNDPSMTPLDALLDEQAAYLPFERKDEHAWYQSFGNRLTIILVSRYQELSEKQKQRVEAVRKEVDSEWNKAVQSKNDGHTAYMFLSGIFVLRASGNTTPADEKKLANRAAWLVSRTSTTTDKGKATIGLALGLFHLSQGNWKGVREDLEPAFSFVTRHSALGTKQADNVAYILTGACIKAKDYTAAEKYIAKSRAYGDTDEKKQMAAKVAFNAGKNAIATDRINSVSRASAQWVKLARLAVSLRIAKGRADVAPLRDPAETLFKSIQPLQDPTDRQYAYFLEGLLLEMYGDIGGADEAVGKALAIDSTDENSKKLKAIIDADHP